MQTASDITQQASSFFQTSSSSLRDLYQTDCRKIIKGLMPSGWGCQNALSTLLVEYALYEYLVYACVLLFFSAF